ncbi:hypothetical protein DICPUDRAFT_99532 [Dictyostelium purpureum]|uniref:TraB family protein n=1 Tax=Dictyostelium purpureum TaxID=5786 RepID=F1A025_DICPU|nr:uncharacterized protein DICPUDRAFT_99532 [Dictyostelium purpureum]EGC30462.1 hypothetical protein DICPUDRAFT_99532 [Dictyostelium purpureum]|eukprot:XP_003293017.1 hypothetical protein DICPUDRAFT_99532 [Dictyostelium purpureum]
MSTTDNNSVYIDLSSLKNHHQQIENETKEIDLNSFVTEQDNQKESDYNSIKNILENNDSSTILPTLTPLPSDNIDFELPSSAVILHSPITQSTIILVGSVHIYKGSSDDVSNVIKNWKPDTVFIELCQSRAGLMLTPSHSRIRASSKKILDNRSKQHYSRTFLTDSGWEDEDQFSSGSKIKMETELADIDIEDMTQEDNELFSTSGTEEDDEDDDEDDDYYGFEFDYDNSKFNSIRNSSSNNNTITQQNNMNLMNNIMNSLNNANNNDSYIINSPKKTSYCLYNEDYKYNSFNLYNNLNSLNNNSFNNKNKNMNMNSNSSNNSNGSNKDNSISIPINEIYSSSISTNSEQGHQILEQEQLQQLQQEQGSVKSFNVDYYNSNYSEADDERSNSPSPYSNTTTPHTTNAPPTPTEDEYISDEPATLKDMINIVKTHGLSGLLHILMAELIRSAGKKSNVNPGSEFITAFVEAKKVGSLVVLGDRLIEITLQRVWNSLSTWEKLKFVFYLFMASFSEVTNEDIDKINNNSDELIDELLNEFRDRFPSVVQTIVTERDQYMAARLRMCPGKKIVAVVGKGHIKGMVKEWTNYNINLNELESVQPSNKKSSDSSWSVVTKWASLILIPIVGITSFLFFNKKYHII